MRIVAALFAALAIAAFTPGDARAADPRPISPEGAKRACHGVPRDATGGCAKCNARQCRWVACKNGKDCVILIFSRGQSDPQPTQSNTPFSPGILGSGTSLSPNNPSGGGTPIAPTAPPASAPGRIN